MPKNICKFGGCNRIIAGDKKYCDEHELNIEQQRKENYKSYDSNRKNDREWQFYKSKEWLKLRNYILFKYFCFDIYCLHVEHRIECANTVHHIIEIREDWNKRLDIGNMFPCSIETHNVIHKLYAQDKEGTQRLLKELIKKHCEEFGINLQNKN